MPERSLGNYRLISQLAVGGMAEIYMARTHGVGGFEKVVALKVIHPNYSEDPEFVQMLVDEAKLAVQLQHSNIVQTFDLGCVDEQYYIAMELIDGVDLYKLLRRAAERDLDFPFEVAAFITQETCNGLDYAHRKKDPQGRPLNIVHRDISPQNVLVSYEGEVKLVDFGIAKASMRRQQTAAGVIKGKYYYMSPEQAWGDPIDARTDVFSTGILLYEMLIGQMLYLEEDMDLLLEKVRKANIPPPSTKRKGVPPELEAIVMQALKKRAAERHQTAGAFGAALGRWLRTSAPSWNRSHLVEFVQQVLGDEPTNKTRDPDVATAVRDDFEADENSLLLKLANAVKSPPKASETSAAKPGAKTPAPEGKQALARLQPVRGQPATPPPRRRDMMTSPVDLGKLGIADPVDTGDYEENEATIVDSANETLMVATPPPRGRSEPTSSIVAPTGRPPGAARPAPPDESGPFVDDEGEGDYTTVDAFSKDSGPTDPMRHRGGEPAGAAAQPAAKPPVDDDPGFEEENATTRMKPQHKRPSQPQMSATPAASARPSQPSMPAAPSRPSQPSMPAAPARPSQPSMPAAPARPSQPQIPVAPAAPSASTSVATGPVTVTPPRSSSAPRPQPQPPGPSPRSSSAPRPQPQPPGPSPRSSSAPRPRPGTDPNLNNYTSLIPKRGRVWVLGGAALAIAGIIAGVVALSTGRSKASIEVVSSPAGALVKLDGTPLSQKTPLEIVDVDPTRAHRVHIALPGYEPWDSQVKFEGGPEQVRVQAVLTPIVGTVELTSTPPGAEAIINGRIRGVTPTVVSDLPIADEVKIELRLRGYRAAHQTLAWPPAPAGAPHRLSASIPLEKSQ
jgi:serine/threonine-protein kinase